MLILLMFFLCITQSAYAMDNLNNSVISGSSSGIEIYRLTPELERNTTLIIIATQLGKKSETINAYNKQALTKEKKIRILELLTTKQKAANDLILFPDTKQANALIESYQKCEGELVSAIEQIQLSEKENSDLDPSFFDEIIALIFSISTLKPN